MSVRLGAAPVAYAKGLFDAWRSRLEEGFGRCHIRGEDIEVGQTRDGEGGLVSARLILRDRTTGQRYALYVAGGVLGIEPVA